MADANAPGVSPASAAPGVAGARVPLSVTLRSWWKYQRWLWERRYHWFRRKKPFEMPSVIYEGLPGSGKTLFMVRDCVEWMRAGFTVASNLKIRDAYSGCSSIPCRSWLEMLELTVDHKRRGVPLIIALDEIHTLCDAREWALTPQWWRDMMSQKRHHGMGLIGTTQALSQVEKRLRSLIAYLVRCERVISPPSVGVMFLPPFVATIAAGWYFYAKAPARFAVFSGWHPLYVGAVGMVLGFIVGLLVGIAAYYAWVILARASWFREAVLNPLTVDQPSSEWDTLSEANVWVPWYAFHSYDTWEVVGGGDFSAMSDADSQARIAALLTDLEGMVSPSEIPAFVDTLIDLGYLPDGRSTRECVDLEGDSDECGFDDDSDGDGECPGRVGGSVAD